VACNESKTEAVSPEPGTPAANAAVPQQPLSRPVPPKQTVTLPVGTRVQVRTTSALSTESAVAGQSFSANLSAPLKIEGKEIAPAGADITGVVADADKGGRVKGVANISLRLTSIEIDGKDVPIETRLFVKNAPASKKRDAAEIGIGAGIGAAIGAIAGGGKGAAIGAGAGGAAGTGVVLATRGKPAVVAAESVITFRLSSPLTTQVD
jgi:hypothetical protein